MAHNLVVIDGDPLKNPGTFQRPANPRLVMKGGKLYTHTL